jgi:4-amino-4-deoxy-L-arabinose transferase-like glycosyltransferase
VGLFLLIGATGGSLQNSTDAIYAVVARDAARGNWLAPEIAGGPYLMKPPLYFWFCALSWKLFGGWGEAFAFRLPSMLSGWAVVFLSAGIAGRIAGSVRAWWAAIFLILMSPTIMEFSRRVFMEELLAATMLLVLYGAIRAVDEDEPNWLWLVGLGSAAAVLTKSYGGGFAGAAVLLWFAILGPRKWLLSRPFLGGIAIGVATLAAYVGMVMQVAPDEFLHQNLAPLHLGSEAQFSWYPTGSFFYFTAPLDPARIAPHDASGLARLGPVVGAGLAFLGGWIALLVGSLNARKERGLSGMFLLLLYVGLAYLVWGSLSQQRLYYLVPFLPALAVGGAVFLDRLLPTSFIPQALVFGGFVGMLLLANPRSFDPILMDAEPALAEIGEQTAGLLPEDAAVFRYNDFFAATELYLDRRAVGLTPDPTLLADFGRILVLGERGIAADGRPAALFPMLSRIGATRPFFLVIDRAEMERYLPQLGELHLWAEARDWNGSLLLLGSVPKPESE